ncbi:acyl-CoA dehydrogenase family protein [Tranquillimonas alkanivorans]|uniref:Acyl-CoA dehydrogenase n=1 Tax=Tranquillimonas alkanivorans TaxID=441119 RepID=A0A1I5SBG0_9RHOB|nr:acyl-CoA dehydrogenase family protein [Tranquillimonas alkanivorans]SFP68051.1 Acyl-CoA dehydrogenase [Tranquillimonas alkanivorans]
MTLADRLSELAPPGPDAPDMATLIAALRREGVLAACAPASHGGADLAHHPDDPVRLLETLAEVGRADLSAGRLFEGHVNAVKLVTLYAEGPQRDRLLDAAGQGALFGVWGADGPDPVRLEGDRLSGQKLFASGADVLDVAVVSARDTDDKLQLLVLERDRLRDRLYPEEWSVSGMEATASGRCDLEGLVVHKDDMLGGPGDFLREPHFQGGVWRYAAVQMGAMRAMTAAAAAQLETRGQADAPLQSARLRAMVTACETARLWLVRAAEAVEHPDATLEAAATSILARLKTAEEAVALMAAMDQALGAASFATSHPVERRRRDLQFYLRQANPDGLGETAMRTIRQDARLARDWSLT